MATCSNCGIIFQKRARGYYRYSLEKNVECSGLLAREHLSELTGSTLTPEKRGTNFLCPECWNKLNEIVRYKHSMEALFKSTSKQSYIGRKRGHADESAIRFIKRPRFTSTPIKKASYSSAKTSKTGKWETIIKAVRARQYGRAIMGLYNATAGSKQKFAEIVKRIVRTEMRGLLRASDFPLNQDVTINSISSFSWNETINVATNTAPVLMSTLIGAITNRTNENSLTRHGTNLKSRLGATLALVLNAKERRCRFLQTLMTVQLWRGRLKRDAIKQISKLRMCTSYEATLTAIDRIRSDFDAAALKCRDDLESVILSKDISPPPEESDAELSAALSMIVPNIDEEIVQYEDMQETVLYSDANTTELSFQLSEPASPVNIHILDDMLAKDESMEIDAPSSSDDDDGSEDMVCEEFEPPVEPELGGEGDVSGFDAPTGPLVEAPGFTLCWDNEGKKVSQTSH